jgi:5-methylthioadenosine/S-adenosylhomocysteine deaminase
VPIIAGLGLRGPRGFEELAGSLRAPLTPEEEGRQRLSRAVFPVVKAFYGGWLDEDARVPFYRPSSRV